MITPTPNKESETESVAPLEVATAPSPTSRSPGRRKEHKFYNKEEYQKLKRNDELDMFA